MIGVDSNIVARFIFQDDPVQSPKADAIMASFTTEEPGWIALATVLEIVWIMSRMSKMDRADIGAVLSGLLMQQEVVLEHAEVVQQALILYRKGKADFADCLIASSARAAGCDQILTFDRIAARDVGMQWAG